MVFRPRVSLAKNEGTTVTQLLLRGHRILVVEDDPFIALDLEMELQAAGAIVIGPVGHIQAGLDLIANEPVISAAILDINIRGQFVFPVADILHQKDVPFVFATGESPDMLPDKFANITVYPKPNSPSEIVQGVATLLAG